MESKDIVCITGGVIASLWAALQIYNAKAMGEAIKESHPDCYKEHENKP